MIALCASLCGADSFTEYAVFGEKKEGFLRQFLQLKHGVPSHDTFSRVFRDLDPNQFTECFARFLDSFFQAHAGIVAIDGKTLRRSFDRASKKSPLQMVSAWATDQQLVLGQVAVDSKSNELKALPKLLEMLSLKGRIVTADALYCVREVAERVLAARGDYLITIKKNQGNLYEDIKTYFAGPSETAESTTMIDSGHGRIETREATVISDVGWLSQTHKWPGLKAIGKIRAARDCSGEITHKDRYFILSRAWPASEFARLARSHWSIENGLHWMLDVVMGEDYCRTRKDHGAQNLAVLRRMALSLIKRDKSKGSHKGKFKSAGWNEDFLMKSPTPGKAGGLKGCEPLKAVEMRAPPKGGYSSISLS